MEGYIKKLAARDPVREKSQRKLTRREAEVLELLAAFFVNDDPGKNEQTKGHQGIVHDMKNSTGNPVIIGKPGTPDHITDLCDDKVRQHLL